MQMPSGGNGGFCLKQGGPNFGQKVRNYNHVDSI